MPETWAESLAEHERRKAELSADIQDHRFEQGMLLWIGKNMADELADALLLRRYTREGREVPATPIDNPFRTVVYVTA